MAKLCAGGNLMPTYTELATEQVWKDQFVPPNFQSVLVLPLRSFYNMGPALIGCPGDNRHLRGRHRSRNWDLTSIYCTNRSYATTDARDKAGDGNWYRAIDIGITGKTLFDACRRLDTLVRSGADGGKVAEWFGTFDGTKVVGWFQGSSSTSDSSHLYHLHIGIWTQWANDITIMQILYETVTGINKEDGSMLCKYKDKGQLVESLQRLLEQLDPNCLPVHGHDGDYGDETATALIACGATIGGDISGHNYGPTEYANLQRILAKHFADDTNIPVHDHNVSIPVSITITGSGDVTVSGKTSGPVT
jgi:hypothetical protein